MKQNFLITSLLMALFSFIVIPLQAEQVNGLWGHKYKSKGDLPSKYDAGKNDRPTYHRNHLKSCRHHKKGQRLQRKFHRFGGMNEGLGYHHNTGNKFQHYSQRDRLSQNSNPGRWDGFNKNRSERLSRDFHGQSYSKQGRKSQMNRHHRDMDRKSRTDHRHWRNDR